MTECRDLPQPQVVTFRRGELDVPAVFTASPSAPCQGDGRTGCQ
jgi:hypothetical protein